MPISYSSDDLAVAGVNKKNGGLPSQVMITDQPVDGTNAYGDGLPGFLHTYPTTGSIWSDTTSNVSYGAVKAGIEAYNTRVAGYNSALSSYNALAAAYNNAVTAERARAANQPLDAPLAVPARPCPPSGVGAFTGTPLIVSNTVALTAAQKATGAATWWEGAPDAKWSVKQGYLQAGTTAAATVGDANAGHVYGLLGQLKTWPAAWSVSTSKGAFQWKTPSGAHEVIVSVMPYAKAQADDKNFELEAINVQFKTDWNVALAAPSAVTPTALLVGAKALGATVLAAAVVQSSLF